MRAWLFLPVLLVPVAVVAGVACSSSSTDTNPTSVASSSSGEVVILDGGGGIPSPPDGGGLCPSGECNYQTNDGCGATDGCLPSITPDGGVAPSCFTAGAKKDGEACTAANDCVQGFICAAGACHKLCCGGDWTGCGTADQHCIESLAFAGADGGDIDTGAMLCFPVNTCDALTPSSCTASGTTCQIADPTGATACLPEGSGDPGGKCPCKGGSTCVAGSCRSLCKAVVDGGAPACTTDEICVHYDRDPAGVGECTP